MSWFWKMASLSTENYQPKQDNHYKYKRKIEKRNIYWLSKTITNSYSLFS
jgi:hypothetical protein